MKTIVLKVQFTYDQEMMYNNDKEGIDWFMGDVLGDKHGLSLVSREIGDDIGHILVTGVQIESTM